DPLQVPSSHAAAHGRPVVRGVHVPSRVPPAAVEHAWQSSVPPAQSVAQHRPSMQWSLAHSARLAQGEPFAPVVDPPVPVLPPDPPPTPAPPTPTPALTPTQPDSPPRHASE